MPGDHARKTGECRICHASRKDRGNRSDFICEPCYRTASLGPIFKCTTCEATGPATGEVIETLRRHLGELRDHDIDQPGVIIFTNACLRCYRLVAMDEGFAPTFEVIAIRPTDSV